jgi:hypothetical protein
MADTTSGRSALVQLATPQETAAVAAGVQTLAAFLGKQRPPKEPLIEGLLYRRDIGAVVGRRRHGKTTLVSNLAFALTLPKPSFLGYSIPQARRVLMFYLEDDAGELQDKLRKMSGQGAHPNNFYLYTRDDFREAGIPIDATDGDFQAFVGEKCRCQPDLIVFDNLGHLIGADYNNPRKMHELMEFTYRLRQDANVAVLFAAHPRKRDKKGEIISLRQDPEAFFEECMGTSHFINSTGSLWGLEKNEERTYFLGGAQRLTGTQGLTALEKNDSDWFEPVSDLQLSFELVVNTEKRRQAWSLLPREFFTYTEALEAVRRVMQSKGSFNPWWNELRRHGLVVPGDDGRFRKAPVGETADPQL